MVRSEPVGGRGAFWRRFISEPLAGYEIRLLEEPGSGDLSAAEEALLEEVFATHVAKSRWELVECCRALPEWQDPQGSAIPITYPDILEAGRKTPAEIAALLDELESLSFVETALRPS